MGSIKRITIQGFKSIKELTEFELKDLNVIVGANGVGKSNFLLVFRMVLAMIRGEFQQFVLKSGGANAFPFCGLKETPEIKIAFDFANSGSEPETFSYRFCMSPTVGESMMLTEERRGLDGAWKSYGSPSLESRLEEQRGECSAKGKGAGSLVFDAVSHWMVYHFHDTGINAPIRYSEIVEDCQKLREDGRNLASFLLRMRESEPECYEKLRNAVRLVMPFFDDFALDVLQMGEAQKVKLTWKQKGTDYPMQPYHLSDGSIRFIALATALLQPNPPTTIVIDEPELGLHPEAIRILAELTAIASKRTQVILATQSPLFLDNFSLDDIVVARRRQGATVFERLKEEEYSAWLEDYTVGELWSHNIIHGGTVYE